MTMNQPERKQNSIPLANALPLPSRMALFAVRTYQATRPFRPSVCRFSPSCSEYTAQCIAKHGVWAGTALGIRRILRCNPLSEGGYDPAP